MKRLALIGALAFAAPASAHDIHADPAVKARLLPAGTAVKKCGTSTCARTTKLRVLALKWSVGCNLSGDEIVHHWEAGLRTALDAKHRRDPADFGAAHFWVDGDGTPAKGADPQDDLFRDAPDILAAFADRSPKTGGRLRVGVLPGSVVAPHLAASCLTTEDGDGSELEAVDGRVLTVPPRAKVRAASGRLIFDLSVNATSLVRRKGSSGVVLHAGQARRALSAAEVRSGDTTLRVPPGRVRAWISLSGVRSANTVRLTAK